MNKTKIVNSLITLIVPVVTVITASVAWFMAKNLEKDNGANGSLGLRTYFYQGDGTKDDPYEIVIPQHLYNLSRLQNFGILKDNSYFRIGHDFENDGNYKCLKVENGVVQQEHVDFLDMSSMKSSFMSIGSEGTPFSGIFEGNNIPVLNLTVDSSLEDMGLFGYCDSDSNIQNLIVSNLTVNCVGYSKEVNAIDDLYTTVVDNALTKNTVFEKADLYYFDKYANKQTKFREEKIIVGTNFNGIDAASETINGVNYSNSYFTPYFDTSDSRFEYDVKVSNNALDVITTDDGQTQVRVNLDFINNNDDFANTNCEIDTRISLVASTIYNNRKYSRVIQTYLAKIYSNRASDKTSTGYTMTVYTDYVDPNSSSQYTNYFHGNNIGFLAGHVDGSMTNCYVYDSKINFNQGDSTIFKPVETESEIGLVGEIGVNVENTLAPEYGFSDKGEIGVINFSGIYSSIRSDFPTNTMQTSIKKSDTTGTDRFYVDYTKYLNQNTYQLYAEYLRTTSASISTYITSSGQNNGGSFQPTSGSAANSVDFFGQKLIEDTATTDRGLGIFKVATSNDRSNFDPTTYNKDTYFINGLGTSSITNGTAKTEIYYTTAENDAKDGITNPTAWYPSNGVHPSGGDYNFVENMSTIPDYADSSTFTSKYEQRSNYVFKLNFGNDYSKVGNNSYFYNTDSKLLQEYFKYKLIDKYGKSIEPGNNRFGLMIRKSDYTQLSSLSSYLTISSNKSITTVNGQQYPANSILFEISNSNGANISVIASSNNNRNGYVSIYGYDYDSSGNLKYLNANGNLGNTAVPLYTMFVPNNDNIDTLKYFNYDSTTGKTDTTAVVASDTNSSNKLFAHIFKVPKGKYFIGSPNGSINIYYMAVQGQTSGTIDEINVAQGINRVAGVDFLLCDPTGDLKKYAKLTYLAKFNTNSGTLRVYSQDEVHLYISLTINDSEVLTFLNSAMVWNQGSASFYLNGTEYSEKNYTYPKA